MGMTAVVQSALYKPLANKDNEGVSLIISSADRFFKLLAKILIVYSVLLVFIYPQITASSFSFLYIGSLIIVMSISLFAQYYFGITNQLLLCADQKLYIPNLLQIVTLILNTLVCALLIFLNLPVQAVYIATTIIYLSRPIYYYLYVKRNYKLLGVRSIKNEPIKQKWNGLAQHIAAVVLDGTGTIVLTLFSTLSNVAIYGVYYLVVSGLNKLLISSTAGFQSYYGELWAKKEFECLTKSFEKLIWSIHTAVIFVFGCAAVLIVPFVKLYTYSISDVNYEVPTFALLLTSAYACYCLRLPYNILVLACNHYKQTQASYIVATIINIVIAVVAVIKLGLVGVALGTIIAMGYQTLWMANYTSKYLIKWPLKSFYYQLFVDAITVLTAYMLCSILSFEDISIMGWILLAVKTVSLWAVSIISINYIFFKDNTMNMVYKVKLGK